MFQENKDDKLKRYWWEEVLYWVVLLIVGFSFISFYKKFLYTNYDNVLHRLFAEKLFNLGMEEMAELFGDMPYIARTYPFYHIVLKVLARLHNWDYFWASYMTLTIVNIMSMALFRELILLIRKTNKVIERIAIDFLSISAILFVVARSVLTDWRYYDVQCAANPLHNPTILFVRPFGIVAFIAFALIFGKYKDGKSYGMELILFAVSIFLSVLAKPSYAFVFLPAMGLVTLIHMIQTKTWKVGLQLLAGVLPAGILLIWQFVSLTSVTQAVKIEVIFGGFTELALLEVFAASIATFPAVIILFSLKDFKENAYYKTSVLALLVGWLQMFLLSNGPAGDFSWGYDLAVQFATVVSIACAMNNPSMSIWRKGIGYLVYIYQVVCGIQYIMLVNDHGNFLI